MNLELLKKKIPYMWRVQSFIPSGGMCVAYIDSRDVQDLLDEAVGPNNWQDDYKIIDGNLYCSLGIKVETSPGAFEWVHKTDCGTESATEKEKGQASDAFKRAAVKWGVGRFLYNLKIQLVKKTEKNGKSYAIDDTGKVLYTPSDLSDYINNRKNNKVDTAPTPEPVSDTKNQETTKPSIPQGMTRIGQVTGDDW
jgi:hypothetical protein